MIKYLAMVMFSLTLVACSSQDKPTTPSSRVDSPASRIDNDNTGKNVRDRDSSAITPIDQSETEADRTITQKIRKTVVADDSLSTNAKNIKIITIKGVVTLRGPVANQQEIDSIIRKASDVQGIVRVDNQLEIAKK